MTFGLTSRMASGNDEMDEERDDDRDDEGYAQKDVVGMKVTRRWACTIYPKRGPRSPS